jgi:uncharacterized BrkB/YihY/UPF0761 family membrane protein
VNAEQQRVISEMKMNWKDVLPTVATLVLFWLVALYMGCALVSYFFGQVTYGDI